MTHNTFDFTKKKRWADILVKEAADVITLVLSDTCKVLYCGTAITEILGWRDVDLVDSNLMDLAVSDDQDKLRSSFEQAIQTNTELFIYVRFKCKVRPNPQSDTKDVLLELQGYPHYTEPGDKCTCFFAAAKAYPGRGATLRNTYVELKMENEHLQQKVAELRDRAMALGIVSNGAPEHPQPGLKLTAPSHYPPHIMPEGAPKLRKSSYESSIYTHSSLQSPATSAARPDDNGVEDGSRKKKPKRGHNGEQYVCITCGRTDSPEWRRGPLGPKTLCNACGLRWAKQTRKNDQPEGGDKSAGGDGGPMNSGPIYT
ncbi:hypothetical protein BDN72DRAFT_755972 [Pluteus cervinus]|uniref:Uncharacterized protein n=1 Tax=Pluteus cervinus TaxID=181527 RepID=A0ACD3BE99_9AGAR|nr:hypothetical protein BDN72DRAFT_755972 [Pluteus cervinus]